MSSAGTARVVNIGGVMQIKDDEPFSDDYFTRTRNFPTMVLGVDGALTGTYTWVEKAGGEIRVEVLVTATLNPATGVVAIEHDTKLFEGTSETTSDLDGRGRGSVQVPRGEQKVLGYTVNNTDEGGDYASVTLTCTNSRLR